MPKIAKSVTFNRVMPITFQSPLGMQEVRVFQIGETVEISDTGAAGGGNYLPAQAAAQLIASEYATPVYDDPVFVSRKSNILAG